MPVDVETNFHNEFPPGTIPKRQSISKDFGVNIQFTRAFVNVENTTVFESNFPQVLTWNPFWEPQLASPSKLHNKQ